MIPKDLPLKIPVVPGSVIKNPKVETKSETPLSKEQTRGLDESMASLENLLQRVILNLWHQS